MSRTGNNQMHNKMKIITASLLFSASLSYPQFLIAADHRHSAPKTETEPDYTKGEKPSGELSEYWTLGPLGADAYFWEPPKGNRHTRDTRMIFIKDTAEGTPAHMLLLAGDVILGVVSPIVANHEMQNSCFKSDARKALSAAITAAESEDQNGKIVLNVWRKGNTLPIAVTLPIKGGFSATSPWDCAKSKTLIDGAANTILKSGFNRKDRKATPGSFDFNIPYLFDALGLLATGEEKYLPAVKDYARALSKHLSYLEINNNASSTSSDDEEGKAGGEGGVDVQQSEDVNPRRTDSWHAAYSNLFLTEYFLITNDQAVLPGIAAISKYVSLGQSGAGTWSHQMANVKANGLYGPPSIYGSMNAAGIPMCISLVLTKKCGIKLKEVDDAIDRTLTFFRWYVNKGIIPYGDHTPKNDHHDSNGKCAMAAVMFDIAGEREGVDYFSRMAVASSDNLEAGHTGPYFGMAWGPLGAARGGPEAAQAYLKRTRWFFELERRPSGSYVNQLPLGIKYKNWSTSGCRLLQLCLPRKALYITGKDSMHAKAVVGTELQAVINAANYDPEKLSIKELLGSLSSWSPVVRNDAAMELGRRPDNVVKSLIELLDSPDLFTRFGACNGLRFAGRQSKEAADLLIEKLKSTKDVNMQYFLVNALKLPTKKQPGDNGIGDVAKGTVNELLKLAAVYDPMNDPRRRLHREIVGVLFGDGETGGFYPGAKGAAELDRTLVVPALQSWLNNPNAETRTIASSYFRYLSENDLKQLWGDIYYTARKPAVEGVMFAMGGRCASIKVMADNHIKEGVEVGINYVVREEGWGKFSRQPLGIKALSGYGTALKDFFPEIEPLIIKLEKNAKGSGKGQFTAALEFMKKTQVLSLVSIESYIKEYEKKNNITSSK